MSDNIKRADAIEAVAEEWLSEASAESPYVNDDDIGEYRKLAEKLFEDVPSAELPKSDLISRADAIRAVQTYLNILINSRRHGDDFTFINVLTEIRNKISELPSAEAEPKWNCTANFVAEQLDRLRNMTDEERWDFLIRFFSPSAEQVTSKLKNPCDSLLTDDSNERKEQKSKLESAEAITIHKDGTLEIKVPNAHKVGRVLVMDTDSHIGGGLFYPYDAVQGFGVPLSYAHLYGTEECKRYQYHKESEVK